MFNVIISLKVVYILILKTYKGKKCNCKKCIYRNYKRNYCSNICKNVKLIIGNEFDFLQVKMLRMIC